jgi:hypothetical protein
MKSIKIKFNDDTETSGKLSTIQYEIDASNVFRIRLDVSENLGTVLRNLKLGGIEEVFIEDKVWMN